jgi:hypothetical protein
VTETECKICHKPFESDGVSTCRDCMGLNVKADSLFHDTAMVQEITPVAQTKKCRICGEDWPASPEYFYRDRGARDGFKGACKGCMSGYEAKARKKRIVASGRTVPNTLSMSQVEKARKHTAAMPGPSPKPYLITVDMSAYSKEYMAIFAYAFSQERTVEGQIKWWLRELADGGTVFMDGGEVTDA